jgi:hypothetical protein
MQPRLVRTLFGEPLACRQTLPFPTEFSVNQPLEGRARRVRYSEGPACQVRSATLDHPFCVGGHDKRAPCPVGGTCLSGPQRHVG